MQRRQFILLGAASFLSACSATTTTLCETDRTPKQYWPKAPKDDNPLENEFEKYPKCPYCGMDRKQFHYSRHLIQYKDDLVDGTCSLRCLALSFSVNLGLVPKAIYAPDNGSALEVKPLVNAEDVHYVIGGDFKAVMTGVAKTSFASREEALKVKGTGEVVDFTQALNLTYTAMGEDTKMMRKRKAEYLRRKALEEQKTNNP